MSRSIPPCLLKVCGKTLRWLCFDLQCVYRGVSITDSLMWATALAPVCSFKPSSHGALRQVSALTLSQTITRNFKVAHPLQWGSVCKCTKGDKLLSNRANIHRYQRILSMLENAVVHRFLKQTCSKAIPLVYDCIYDHMTLQTFSGEYLVNVKSRIRYGLCTTLIFYIPSGMRHISATLEL